MKGIIAAGGKGTRLYPLTLAVGKPLLPVYDKPMIYYPLYTLMLAGIREIAIICTRNDLSNLKLLLGNGDRFGVRISYIIQEGAKGIAEAFLLAEDFICNDSCCLILGDNIFYGDNLKQYMLESIYCAEHGMCNIYGYCVDNPKNFGVIELDSNNNVLSIEEKPLNPKSNCCAIGLYFYPKDVSAKAKLLKPSTRNELEITDLNNLYLLNSNIKVTIIDSDYIWFDTGTFNQLLKASIKVKELEESKNINICSPEELALNNNWIKYNH